MEVARDNDYGCHAGCFAPVAPAIVAPHLKRSVKMKFTTMKGLSVFSVLMALGLGFGSYWGTHAVVALNGLRSTDPFTHEEEVAFIRSRVDFPIVPPEWVSGIESNELLWIKYEILARGAVPISVLVTIILLVRSILLRKNQTNKAEPAATDNAV